MKRVSTLLCMLLAAVVLLSSCGAPLALDQTELNMTVGDSVKLNAGDAVKVSWTSSDNAVATVNGGTVSAKAAGTAVITASLENGEKATCAVTVTDKLINVITLDVKSARIEEGKTIQLTASYAPADATKTTLSWSSSNESVAKVDDEGYVTGVSEGTATITCKSENDVEASCTVTVGAAQLPTTTATLPSATEAPQQTPTIPDETSEETATTPPVSGESGFIFPDSSERYLTDGEVLIRLSSMSGMPVSDSFSQDAINEIFARHGYIFRTPAIRAYYEAQSWYKPDPSYDGSLNAVEQYNIALLSKY